MNDDKQPVAFMYRDGGAWELAFADDKGELAVPHTQKLALYASPAHTESAAPVDGLVIELRPIVMADAPDAHQVWLMRGSQQFPVGNAHGTKAEATWYAAMLRKAVRDCQPAPSPVSGADERAAVPNLLEPHAPVKWPYPIDLGDVRTLIEHHQRDGKKQLNRGLTASGSYLIRVAETLRWCLEKIEATPTGQQALSDAESQNKPVGSPIPGSPAFALRGLYKVETEYFIDGNAATPDEYIAWQREIIEALASAKIPDPKYYGTQDADGDQHDVKCAYVDGWNECRANILAITPTPSSRTEGLTEEPPRLWGQVLSVLRQAGIEWDNAGWVFPNDDALHNFARTLLAASSQSAAAPQAVALTDEQIEKAALEFVKKPGMHGYVEPADLIDFARTILAAALALATADARDTTHKKDGD